MANPVVREFVAYHNISRGEWLEVVDYNEDGIPVCLGHDSPEMMLSSPFGVAHAPVGAGSLGRAVVSGHFTWGPEDAGAEYVKEKHGRWRDLSDAIKSIEARGNICPIDEDDWGEDA